MVGDVLVTLNLRGSGNGPYYAAVVCASRSSGAQCEILRVQFDGLPAELQPTAKGELIAVDQKIENQVIYRGSTSFPGRLLPINCSDWLERKEVLVESYPFVSPKEQLRLKNRLNTGLSAWIENISRFDKHIKLLSDESAKITCHQS